MLTITTENISLWKDNIIIVYAFITGSLSFLMVIKGLNLPRVGKLKTITLQYFYEMY